MTFYETLRRAMDMKNVAFPELCERTGLYPSYFSKLKSGHMRDVTWEKAIEIIAALGMTPDEFRDLQKNGE
ncbi:MAG: helix-turn-helix transcriptional regulator [Atopobiaceae bacterium]|nr:helix-turn-helix transcriptional regulator [Atopobiaceae bacterium]